MPPLCAGGVLTREVLLTLTRPVSAASIQFIARGGLVQTPAPPTPTALVDTPVSGSDTLGDFTLTVSSPHSVYSESQAIDVQAALSRAQGSGWTDLSGSGSGLIVFGVKELGGTREMGGLSTADCAIGRYTVSPGDPLVVPFFKSGGFSGSDPDAAFWRSYFADPLLHLPAGNWEISADATFDEGAGCSAQPTRIHAAIDITVEGDQATSAPTQEPASPVFDCSPVPGASRHATLADLTGLVQSCAGTEPAGLLHPQPPVANPGGDLLRLVVQWAGTPCDASVAFTLQQTADGYTLDGQRPGGSCITPGVQHALEIRLSQPIDASTVVVQIPYQ